MGKDDGKAGAVFSASIASTFLPLLCFFVILASFPFGIQFLGKFSLRFERFEPNERRFRIGTLRSLFSFFSAMG